jgi:hypothetical protein
MPWHTHPTLLTHPCTFPSQYPLTPAYFLLGGPQGLQNLMLLSLLYLFWWRFLLTTRRTNVAGQARQSLFWNGALILLIHLLGPGGA